MNNECEKRGGCRNEKNSVNLGHSTNEGSATMPVKKENRDYAKEYQREKSASKAVCAKLKISKYSDFSAKLELEGSNANAKINKWIDMYLAGELD